MTKNFINKKIIAVLLISFLFSSTYTYTGSAHPGRTDSSGGHVCNTNCASWGLEYGEYHYGSSEGSTGNTTNYIKEEDDANNGWLWGVAGLGAAGYIGYGVIKSRNEQAQRNEARKAMLQDNVNKGLVCVRCSSALELKYGRYGKFYGCSSYPACHYSKKVEQDKDSSRKS